MIKECVAAAIVLVSVVVISTLALRGDSSAAGALISVVSAGVGWYLRGKVVEPNA